MKIRARFAPSPTGYLHLGGARTALFNWAFITHLQQNGTPAEFLLRIEDTDVERSTQSAIDAILQAMKWLNLNFDGDIIYQTHRLARYREVADDMVNKGLAYRCYATKEELESLREEQKKRGEKPRYDRRWRHSTHTPPPHQTPVIRFANPLEGIVHWRDVIKGDIAIDNAELDDFVIVRADGVPTYNFANVVDDHDSAITHVIRGDDHVNNTPKQINLYRALGYAEPQFGHLPMIHGDDGEKLSKRHGAVNVMEYRDQGILPEALMNYLARLGFSHGNDEIFSLHELAKWFDWASVNSSPARFDRQKLLWLNQHYLMHKNADELITLILGLSPNLMNESAKKINLHEFAYLYRERSATVPALITAVQSAMSETHAWNDDDKKSLADNRDVLHTLIDLLQSLPDHAWSAEGLAEVFKQCLAQTNKKMGQLGVPLRLALVGEKQSPAVNLLLACFHRHWALEKINRAMAGES